MTMTETTRTARHLGAALLITWLTTGCAMPYAASYEPILDPADERLVKAESIEHRWVENMQQASANMYRQGYAMVGYSYLIGGHLPAVAPAASRNWGRDLDAAYVLQVRNGSLYLATYWRRVTGFELGAYYVDAPAAAHRSIGLDTGVIVQDVVQGTPAAEALLMPGDLLLALDDEMIPSARWLDDAIAGRAGEDVTLTVWPMQGIEPINMTVTLARR